MRHTCTQCGTRTNSWQHTTTDDQGHGTQPVCDQCAKGHAT